MPVGHDAPKPEVPDMNFGSAAIVITPKSSIYDDLCMVAPFCI